MQVVHPGRVQWLANPQHSGEIPDAAAILRMEMVAVKIFGYPSGCGLVRRVSFASSMHVGEIVVAPDQYSRHAASLYGVGIRIGYPRWVFGILQA